MPPIDFDEMACRHCNGDHFTRECPDALPGECTKSRCKKPATGAAVACACGKTYRFCDGHGGVEAARRSLKSHMGLYHPRKPAT